jgi:hypothetical protein
MSIHFVKIIAVFILSSFVFVISCQADTDASEKLQVYNENGTPFNQTIELVGVPSARLNSGYYPWKLYGRIVNGKMEIDFPDVELVLGSHGDYQLQYDTIYIERKNASSTKFGLYMPGRVYDNRVYIYYSTGNYETEEGFQLKTGWNFVEELKNPNWSYDNNEPYSIAGLISKNVNDFYKKGYRWQVERWI